METFESVDKIKTRVVGIDIRIEKTTIALVDIRGDIVAQDYFPTTDYPDVNDFLTALSENIFALLEENGGYESVRSIGVSAPSASYITGCIENAAISRAVSRTQPTCLGRVSSPWQRCCATVLDWLWQWPMMPISRHWVREPMAVRTV